jgi:hypothetical protein
VRGVVPVVHESVRPSVSALIPSSAPSAHSTGGTVLWAWTQRAFAPDALSCFAASVAPGPLAFLRVVGC